MTFTRVGATPGVRDPVTQQTTGAKDLVFSMQAVGFGPGKSAEFRIGSLIGRNLEELHLAPMLGTCPEPGDLAKWARIGKSSGPTRSTRLVMARPTARHIWSGSDGR